MRYQDLIPVRGKEFSCSPECLEGLWGPHNLLGMLSVVGKVADYSSASTDQVKNVCDARPPWGWLFGMHEDWNCIITFSGSILCWISTKSVRGWWVTMENSLLWVLDPEDDGTAILRNVSNYLTFGVALDARRLESSTEDILSVSESHSYIHPRELSNCCAWSITNWRVCLWLYLINYFVNCMSDF